MSQINIINCLIILIIGWFSGSLVGYLADVLPKSRKLIVPVCSKCGQFLGLGNYLLLIPCAACGEVEKKRKIITNILVPLSFLYLYLFAADKQPLYLSMILIVYFYLVSVVDIEHRAVLYIEVYIGVIICGISGSLIHGWKSTLIGGAAGFIVMYLLFLMGKLFSRYIMKNNRDDDEEVALGFGDVNLGGVVGLILGWPGITAGLLIAILLGGAASLGIIIYSKIRKNYTPYMAIPYVPFLILATVILLFRPS